MIKRLDYLEPKVRILSFSFERVMQETSPVNAGGNPNDWDNGDDLPDGDMDF